MDKEKIVIGRNEAVDFTRNIRSIPAKIDTGADSSSIWVSHIRVDRQGVLRFNLFDTESPYYTGKTIKREHYRVAVVRSTTGHEQVRYRTQLSVRVGGKKIRAMFNLSDRSQSRFPVLIGRRTLSGKFIVDVSKSRYSDMGKIFKEENQLLNQALSKDPYEFYKKLYKKTGLSIRKKV